MKINHPTPSVSGPTPGLRGNGRRRSPRAATAAKRRKKSVTSQPHYDANLNYDLPGLRYAVSNPTPAGPEGGKVRLDNGNRTDSDLAAFAEAHREAMVNNLNFPNPVPPVALFDQWLGDFEAKLTELENLRVAMKNLTEQKDVMRATLQAGFAQRAQYVEMASNGNPDIIATSGLPLRRPPTPVGQLPWPQNLRVEVAQVNGEVVVRWLSVGSARGYMLQCAEVVPNEPRNWHLAYTGGKFSTILTGLVPGKTYEFRVAALGGTNGQSAWSPVVARMVA
jgi:hypothetical protein